MALPITVITTTYFPPDQRGQQRLETFKKALQSWCDNLYSDGSNISLHMADDGSAQELFDEAVEAVNLRWFEGGVTVSRQERYGVGASLNQGLRQAFEFSPLALYIVDDWELLDPLDLLPWASLLERDESLGAIRLGPAHPDLTGMIKHDPHTGQFYVVLDRHHFVLGHRPIIYHKRLIDQLGWFPEGVNAFECERQYNERFCYPLSPHKVALALPELWRHISDIELADIEPGK